jgi:hypothetical protein
MIFTTYLWQSWGRMGKVYHLSLTEKMLDQRTERGLTEITKIWDTWKFHQGKMRIQTSRVSLHRDPSFPRPRSSWESKSLGTSVVSERTLICMSRDRPSWDAPKKPGEKKRYCHLVGGSTPPKTNGQLGWLFPVYGKIKNVPNHQPVVIYCACLWERNIHVSTSFLFSIG